MLLQKVIKLDYDMVIFFDSSVSKSEYFEKSKFEVLILYEHRSVRNSVCDQVRVKQAW